MKYSEMRAGMYVVRTRDLTWAYALSGEILYVQDVKSSDIYLRITDQCVPVGKTYVLPAAGDDNNWYDVTELVMDANSCIPPAPAEYAYSSDVAVSYRNSLGLQESLKPTLNPEGQVCVIGAINNGQISFGRYGYYVIACDSNGYMIVYSGYCSAKDSVSEQKKLTILNLLGTNRVLYPAKEIVTKSNMAYNEDVTMAAHYVSELAEDTLAASSESIMSGGNIERIRELTFR